MSLSVEKWLGSENKLGIDIWNKKYRFENETFEDWLNRISNNNEELKQIILDKKFIFAGRILANRGLNKWGKKITYSNCFLPGTKVLTKDGYKNIEEIEVGEYVFSHTNKWNRVNGIMHRPYKGIIYKINSSNLLDSIYCTPNHKFFINNSEWKSVDSLKIKLDKGVKKVDKLTSPKELISYEWSNITIDLLKDFSVPNNRRIYINEDNIGLEEYINDRGTNIWRKPRYFINRYFVLDEEMLYLIGRWIGDGSITKRVNKSNPSVWQIVFNATNENEACDKCFNIIKKHFPLLNPNIRKTEQNILALRIDNELFSSWFENNFGHGCDGKYIPNWLGYPKNLLLGLLDADGSVHSEGNFKLLLKNPSLIEWARMALYHLGINTSSIKSENRQIADSFTIFKNQNSKLVPHLHKIYEDKRMSSFTKDATLVKIDSIDILNDYNTTVYNLSVENDNSYLVNGVFAHNCYVLDLKEDSIEGIYDLCSRLARTYSYGGGCGIDISKLRPYGAKVNNAAKTTTGAVSFMSTFDNVTSTIGQNGRRGALMISIDVRHPDVMDFVDIKTDVNKINSANISVRVNDEFMKAVENDEDYILRWPCEVNDIYGMCCKEYNKLYSYTIDKQTVYFKKIKAKELFRKLCENNWNYAEPGILYWDRISNYNLLSEDKTFKYAGVNPCVKGDTLILTDNGYKPIAELCDREVNVWNGYEYSNVIPHITGYNQKMVKVTASNGMSVDCTLYHKFLLANGTRKEAKDLVIGDKLPKWNYPEMIENDTLNLPFNVINDNSSVTIIDIKPIEDADVVYCMNEPKNHTFIANGLLVGNCAEEPLPAGGSCLLGSINLAAFIDEKGEYDFSELERVTKIAYKGLNDVLLEGLPLHPLKEQRENVGKYRQIGLGIMGLADTFIKMKIRYGSSKSIDLSNKIGSTIANAIIRESIETGKKRHRVALKKKHAINSEYFKNVATEGTSNILKNSRGLFNTQLLTIAPTGTISTMWNISGGIEPIFAFFYERLTKSLNGTDTKYTVYPEIVKEYFGNDEVKIEDLPDYYVCSSDLTTDERVKMQSTWQKYIDASISSTVNLPEETTIEDVEKIYMEAWKKGLKGITIFRSGCKRSAILTNNANKKECNCKDFLENSAPKRPKTLPCKIVRFRNNKENWIGAVGLYEGRPYEIFTGLSDKLNIPTSITTGFIVKNKVEKMVYDEDTGKEEKKMVSRYDIQYKDGDETKVVEGLSTCFNVEFWNYGKLISGLLRHGMPMEYIVKVISTLNFKDDSINSWKNGVIRILKKFLKDGETDEVCPECGSKMVRENGCVHCPNCGWSKCG